MQKTKFNKRVGKETPSVRCFKSGKAGFYFLTYSPIDKNNLLIKMPSTIFYNPPFQSVEGISWNELKDWILSKAF